jgi:hypothetical protein
MVESKTQSGLEMMFTNYKTMTIVEFLPLLNPWDLVRICRLNKACHYLMQAIVNFEVLLKT